MSCACQVARRPLPQQMGDLGVVQLAALAVSGAIAGVQLAMQLLRNRRGPQQKLRASQFADEAERLLQQNLHAFQLAPQTLVNQRAALETFDGAWDELRSLCSDPDLGDPGRRCVSERDRGGRWDWFALYREPIAQAPLMATPEPLPAAAPGLPADSGLPAPDSGPVLPLWLGIAMIGVGVWRALA